MKQVMAAFVAALAVAGANGVHAEEGLSADVNPSQPTPASLTKGKRALVWCTNSVGRISRGQMYGDQIATAVEKYFSQRDGLEKEIALMGFKPTSEKDMPPISAKEDKAAFANMTYQEIIRYCDGTMMQAYNDLKKRAKPTNLAERKIAEFGSLAKQDELMKEQSVGKKLGFEGITYGLVDSMEDLRRGRYTVADLQKFLIKPDMYDQHWEVIGSQGTRAAYGTWSGDRPLLFVVNKATGREYLSGNLLPMAYYKVEGVESFTVLYHSGKVREDLLVLKEVATP